MNKIYTNRSQNIKDLQISSKEALSRPEFSNILWIGVFGSFARNEQTDKSDVDIIVIEKSDAEDVDLPSGFWTLEDLLPRVWCRPIDVIRILKRELRGWISVHALLTSRTLYGDAQSEEVLRLRLKAKEYLDYGRRTFEEVDKKIRALKTKADNIGAEKFKDSRSDQNSIREDLLELLTCFDIEPVWHPIHEGFWSTIIQPSVEIKRIATIENEDPERIWDIVANPSPRSIHNLAVRLEKFVFPSFEEIEKRIGLAKRLEERIDLVEETGDDIGGAAVVVEKSALSPGPLDQPGVHREKKKPSKRKVVSKIKECIIT